MGPNPALLRTSKGSFKFENVLELAQAPRGERGVIRSSFDFSSEENAGSFTGKHRGALKALVHK
jgi:hypothetical protein